jgi:MFS family permease
MGAIAGAVMALAADATRESQRTKIMAIIGISIGFSFYLALLLGPLVSASFGLKGIFIVTAIGASLCLPMIKWGVKTPINQAPSGDSLPNKSAIRDLFTHPELWRFNVSVLLIHLLITSFFVQVPSLLASANFELDVHWKIYTPILILSVVLMVILMRVSGVLARKRVFMISLALMAFAFFLLINMTTQALRVHWIWIVCAGILFFAGFNYMEANLPAMVSSIAPAGQKGTAMGLYASFQFFGAFAGGLLTGALIQWFNPMSVYLLCLVVIALLGIVIYGAKSVGKTARFTLELNESDKRNMAKIFELESILRQVEGVIEVSVSEVDNAIYVKATFKKVSLEQLYIAIGRSNKVEPYPS